MSDDTALLSPEAVDRAQGQAQAILASLDATILGQEELTRMVKAATEASAGDAARAADALDALLGVRVTAELLADTGVGKEVKRLSKSEGNAELAAKAKAVVNAWKKIVVG